MKPTIAIFLLLPLLACTTSPWTKEAEQAPPPVVEAVPSAAPPVTVVTPAPTYIAPTTHVVVHTVTATTGHHGGGCGSRGGPGYRLPNGKCASWHHKRR
jgi:hypothetical protein